MQYATDVTVNTRLDSSHALRLLCFSCVQCDEINSKVLNGHVTWSTCKGILVPYHNASKLMCLCFCRKIWRLVQYSSIYSALKLKFRKYPAIHTNYSCSTGIIRFFTKQIATEGFSTVFGQSRCALWHTKSIKPRKFGNIVKMRLEN